MPTMFNRLVRAAKIAAIVGAVVGLVRKVRTPTTPPATGQAQWKPIAEPTPPEPRVGPVTFSAPAETTTWVAPVDGQCPVSHPVKGNAGSGIFHVPGGLSYDRTVPERCYATPADAEADGFRQAKR